MTLCTLLIGQKYIFVLLLHMIIFTKKKQFFKLKTKSTTLIFQVENQLHHDLQ